MPRGAGSSRTVRGYGRRRPTRLWMRISTLGVAERISRGGGAGNLSLLGVAYPARARPLEGGEGCRFPASRPCALVDAAAARTRDALFATFTMACASAACASTAANATVEVSNATSTSGDLGDPLLSLARDPSLPRELRARVRAASRELADAGLATLAATALETYGGAAGCDAATPTRPTPPIQEHPPLTLAAPPLRPRRRRATSPPCAPR